MWCWHRHLLPLGESWQLRHAHDAHRAHRPRGVAVMSAKTNRYGWSAVHYCQVHGPNCENCGRPLDEHDYVQGEDDMPRCRPVSDRERPIIKMLPPWIIQA